MGGVLKLLISRDIYKSRAITWIKVLHIKGTHKILYNKKDSKIQNPPKTMQV